MRTFKVILITGGIGAGKSEAARHIASCGIPVYDSDSRVKMLYDNDIQLVENTIFLLSYFTYNDLVKLFIYLPSTIILSPLNC